MSTHIPSIQGSIISLITKVQDTTIEVIDKVGNNVNNIISPKSNTESGDSTTSSKINSIDTNLNMMHNMIYDNLINLEKLINELIRIESIKTSTINDTLTPYSEKHIDSLLTIELTNISQKLDKNNDSNEIIIKMIKNLNSGFITNNKNILGLIAITILMMALIIIAYVSSARLEVNKYNFESFDKLANKRH